jgi:SAM-dependent methyltransferase
MLAENEKLTQYYQSMVDWDKRLAREGPFILKIFRDAGTKKILDCACGIGRHVLYLRQNGFEADGCDLSASQLKEATDTARAWGIEASFFLEDMQELPLAGGRKYNGLMTVGNTLCSLGREKARAVLSRFGQVLAGGGVVLGQVLNYESFKKEDVTELRQATIDGVETIFLKTFHFEEDHVAMIMNSLRKENKGWVNDLRHTSMYYLDTAFFEDALKSAGFDRVDFYGDMTGGPFIREKSRDLVFAAYRTMPD